ncbi:unnamed protein product [Rotaria sordida]|uniref:MULE transposase domain-containing protein n=1 Tax=Rotaria sordida TaxID=392033 RepID=A0A814Z2Y9_9BILA|nr:unnamed protein product [Rotaria sordida]
MNNKKHRGNLKLITENSTFIIRNEPAVTQHQQGSSSSTVPMRHEYGTATKMSMFQQIRWTGYRKRLKVLPPCPKRTNLRSFEIPQSFHLNSLKEPFLIHDSADPYRIIVFASKTSLRYLGMKPVCYSATEKKDLKTYLTLFQSLKDAAIAFGINIAPSSHLIDFEIAASKASKEFFHNTDISYCHFHFAQAIWRKIKNLNSVIHEHLILSIMHMLYVYYSDLIIEAHEKNIQKHIVDLISLPMVPTNLVRERFEIISQELCWEDLSFKPFISYLRRTYINSKQFPIASWNHYNYLGIRSRTNNRLEGSHRQLKKYI